jgi:hypothetical protein
MVTYPPAPFPYIREGGVREERGFAPSLNSPCVLAFVVVVCYNVRKRKNFLKPP